MVLPAQIEVAIIQHWALYSLSIFNVYVHSRGYVISFLDVYISNIIA